jgi:uncharacterized membrane protein
MNFPHTPHAIGIWILAFSILYLVVATWRRLASQRTVDGQTVFDSAAFATSILLLIGVIDEDPAKALGDTTQFLVIAGLAGTVYGIRALV